MKKIMITGITGFIGSHLAERLLEEGDCEIYGMCRWRSPRDNLINIYDKVNLFDADLTDLSSLIYALEEIKPDVIYGLASQSYVKTSYHSPVQTLWANVIGTNNLLEAIKITKQNPRILYITSSECYGQVTEADIPITEECPFRPHSPYGVSKVAQDMILYQYADSYNMNITRIRNFSTTGPRRGDVFFMSAFTKQIASILLKKQEPIIRVGNLDSIRTVCDVRDMVRAYILACNNGKSGDVYNIGGNDTMSVGDYLFRMINLYWERGDKYKPRILIDTDLYRPSDVTLQIPSMNLFKKNISSNWKPEIDIDKTIRDMVKYWHYEIERNPWKINTVEE